MIVIQQLQHPAARHRFDPAHSRRHRAFGHDAEQPQLRRVVHMGAAAEFHRHVPDADHPHNVPVLLAEQGHGAQLAGLLDGHFPHHRLQPLHDPQVDQSLHLPELVARQGGEMGEVEPHPAAGDQLARLLHMIAQHPAQRRLQQMGRRVVAHGGRAADPVHLGRHRVPRAQQPLLHHAAVQEHAPGRLAGLAHKEQPVAVFHRARVPRLAAAFGVEGGFVQHQDPFLALGEAVGRRACLEDGQHLRGPLQALVAREPGGGQLLGRAGLGLPGVRPRVLAGGAGSLALLLHQAVEFLLIHRQPFFRKDVLGQIHREPVRVVQTERVRPGQHRARQIRQHVV